MAHPEPGGDEWSDCTDRVADHPAGLQVALQCLSSVTGKKRASLLICFAHLPLRGVVTLETAVCEAPSFTVSTLFWVLLSAAQKSLCSVVHFPELCPTLVKATVQEFCFLRLVTRN